MEMIVLAWVVSCVLNVGAVILAGVDYPRGRHILLILSGPIAIVGFVVWLVFWAIPSEIARAFRRGF